MKTDERKKLNATAKSKASEVMAQENEAKMRAKLEELFRETLEEKAAAEAEKDKSVEDNTKLTEDLENLKTEKEELATQKSELEAKADELQTKLDDADKKIEELEGAVEKMKQEAAVKARVAELEEAGLLAGSKLSDKRLARIKSMDDEEFAEYKSELVELKTEWSAGSDSDDDDKEKSKKSDDKKKTKKTKKVDESDSDDDDELSDEDKAAKAALAQLAELDDIDEAKITATDLLKLKRAAAAFNVASLAVAGMDDDEDAFGIEPEMQSAYDSMWEEE